MNSPTTRSRAATAIIAEIIAIQNPVAGTLSKLKRTLKNGGEATYHILQRWENGKNVSAHVPEDKVEHVAQGIERHRRLKELFRELAEAGTLAVLAGTTDPGLEKKTKSSRTFSPTRAKKRASRSTPSTR